jgi:hypothetical protein
LSLFIKLVGTNCTQSDLRAGKSFLTLLTSLKMMKMEEFEVLIGYNLTLLKSFSRSLDPRSYSEFSRAENEISIKD